MKSIDLLPVSLKDINLFDLFVAIPSEALMPRSVRLRLCNRGGTKAQGKPGIMLVPCRLESLAEVAAAVHSERSWQKVRLLALVKPWAKQEGRPGRCQAVWGKNSEDSDVLPDLGRAGPTSIPRCGIDSARA